jgi:hypothetical protein
MAACSFLSLRRVHGHADRGQPGHGAHVDEETRGHDTLELAAVVGRRENLEARRLSPLVVDHGFGSGRNVVYDALAKLTTTQSEGAAVLRGSC